MKLYRPRPYLAPIAALHGLVLRARHACFEWGLFSRLPASLPTWVLGNITAGGTGKSPHVRLFVQELEAVLGPGTVGVLSRGHGRKSRGFRWVECTSPVEEVGDEPLMLKFQMREVPVAVCIDRVEGVRLMQADKPSLRWVVLDDAFQHRRLEPDVATVLLDATQPVTQDRLIPAGRLRDLRSSLKLADSALLTRSSDQVENEINEAGWHGLGPIWATRMHEGVPQPWSKAAHDIPLLPRSNPAEQQRILAVAGIARPERFMDMLAKGFQVVRREAHSDHHAYTESEVRAWRTAFDTDGVTGLVTTEKDAARLESHRSLLEDLPIYFAPMEAVWVDPNAARAWIQEVLETAERRRRPKNEDI